MNIYKGTIITCDRDDNVFKYLVENGGKIEYTGNSLPESYKGAEITDLGKKALLPAFADTHIHFTSFAVFNSGLDIRSASSLKEMQESIRSFAEKRKDPILLGFGASTHCVKEKRLLSRTEIDEVCSDRPVFIVKYDGHACIVNSKLIDMLPSKIRSLRGFHGDTGEMNQEAFFATTDFATKKISLVKNIQAMIDAADFMAGRGIGMIHSVAGVGFPLDIDVDLERVFARGLKNPMQMRIFFQTMDVKKVLKRKLPRVGGCFATALDGCFGSQDAAMNKPYANDRSNKGVLFHSDEEVIEFVKKANRNELQVELHAIGDAAFDQAVRAFEAALKDYPRKDHRHTIIHACLPTATGLKKCAEMGISIALQSSFLYWPLEPLDYLESIMGKRVYDISPLRKMADMGIIMSGGSDAPCTLPDPIGGIWAACNHYVPKQSLTIQEALKLFTYNAAWTTFDEKERGSLETGKIADMTILDRNPLTMKPKDLMKVSVEELLLSGKRYEPGQSLPSLIAKGLFNRTAKI